VLKNGGLHRVMRAEKCHHLRSSAAIVPAERVSWSSEPREQNNPGI
jgi:hypothetical protein